MRDARVEARSFLEALAPGRAPMRTRIPFMVDTGELEHDGVSDHATVRFSLDLDA